LKPVIHNDDARSGGSCEFRSGDAITGDDGGGKARQQNRFIANIPGTVQRGADAHRAGEPPAITAAQKERTLVGGMEKLRQRESRRSFAGAADGEIA
jgi:hypothetical protein